LGSKKQKFLMLLLQIIFWVLLSLIMSSYLLYPIVLSCINLFLSKKQTNNTSQPSVSIIIPCYKETNVLIAKINNTLALSYPKKLLQIIIVVEDLSQSLQEKIKEHHNILIIENPTRLGKSKAINLAMAKVDNEFTVFTDANTQLNTHAIEALIKGFNNPNVGAVSGEKCITTSSKNVLSSMEGWYWKYESFIKKVESNFIGAVGGVGELFCIKTSLYKQLSPNTILDDFIISFNILQQGFTIQYQPNAIASELANTNFYDEFIRKARIGAGAYQTLANVGFLPYKSILLSLQFFIRRVVRWVVCPIALPIIFGCNCYLVVCQNSNLFFGLLITQLLFYILAFLGLICNILGTPFKLFSIPFYFLFMNVCVLFGGIKFILKKHHNLWQKNERQM
jgi:poly-beta-1,6-N-acetyl-D-glucosamine synthase